jgi:predicted Kef-type K+ transport protein
MSSVQEQIIAKMNKRHDLAELQAVTHEKDMLVGLLLVVAGQVQTEKALQQIEESSEEGKVAVRASVCECAKQLVTVLNALYLETDADDFKA